MKQLIAALFLLTLAVGCQQSRTEPQSLNNRNEIDDQVLRGQAMNIFAVLPAQYENPDNRITSAKVKLGRLLFFDNRLSKNGTVSCNSCHNLATYGVDNEPVSQGDGGEKGKRNSPSCLNAAGHFAQFWDGRAKDVEEQAGGPILNPVEMNIPSQKFLVNRLSSDKKYPALFAAAFPGEKEPLTYQNIQKSIAAFERTLVTPAPLDRYLMNDLTALTNEEKRGLQTFMSLGCSQCHNGAEIGGNSFQKFGIHADYRAYTHSSFNDIGRKDVTFLESDKDLFKVPSLRNVVKTYPYFHDGSISDLREAVRIMGKVQLGKDLTEVQVNQIVAFLRTLTGDIPEEYRTPPKDLSSL